jgi:diacylglycerol kinase (ATP)
LLLVNCHSRSGQECMTAASAALRKRGLEVTVSELTRKTSPSELIRKAQGSIDLVVVAGGDGTLNAAADGLLETRMPLGLIPSGTANDLARTLEIPTDVEAACDVIAAGKTRRVDLGQVNGKHFFNVASLGLSVALTQRLTGEKKRRWGVLAYLITAISVVWRARPFRARVILDGKATDVLTVQIAVGNGRFYGGGMTVDEGAEIDDHRLHVYCLQTRHWWQIVRLLPAMRRGTLADAKHATTFTCQQVEITTRRPRLVNTDGEITTGTPAKFVVVPQCLNVFVPEQRSS